MKKAKRWLYELEYPRKAYGTLVCPYCKHWILLTPETTEEIKAKRKKRKR